MSDKKYLRKICENVYLSTRTKIIFLALLSSIAISGCSPEPIRSINEDVRAAVLRIKLEDPKTTRVSDLLTSDEDFLCVMFQLGGVGAKNDKFNKASRLKQLNPPWIADDGYWSIVFYSKNDHVERVFGINRVKLIDLDVNDKDMCFSPDTVITRSDVSLPNKSRFIKFN